MELVNVPLCNPSKITQIISFVNLCLSVHTILGVFSFLCDLCTHKRGIPVSLSFSEHKIRKDYSPKSDHIHEGESFVIVFLQKRNVGEIPSETNSPTI